MNRGRDIEHRIPTSLSRHVPTTPLDRDQIRALINRARGIGIIVFMKEDLDAMPWASAEIIKAEAKRLAKQSL